MSKNYERNVLPILFIKSILKSDLMGTYFTSYQKEKGVSKVFLFFARLAYIYLNYNHLLYTTHLHADRFQYMFVGNNPKVFNLIKT